MRPAPILEMARAYGLRPPLWLLMFVQKIALIEKIFPKKKFADISLLFMC